jgi:hypothetical protein
MTPFPNDAKHLLDLAERMGLPADEAIRQVSQHLADLERPGTDRPDAGRTTPTPAIA